MSTAIESLSVYVGIADVLDIMATSVLIYYVLLLDSRNARGADSHRHPRARRAARRRDAACTSICSARSCSCIVVGAAVTHSDRLSARAAPRARADRARRILPHRPRRRRGWLRRRKTRRLRRWRSAAFLLSRNRLGALIVIEQQSGLKEFVESGTMLERQSLRRAAAADLHAALAAARRRGDRSRKPHRSGRLLLAARRAVAGERRRRARAIAPRSGLTEQTDAVVRRRFRRRAARIYDRARGKLSRPWRKKQRLVKMLLAVTRPPRDATRLARQRSRLAPARAAACRGANRPRTPCVQIIRKNFGLKVLSLALAIVGWAYFRLRGESRSSRRASTSSSRVPIVAVNLPVGYVAHFTERKPS